MATEKDDGDDENDDDDDYGMSRALMERISRGNSRTLLRRQRKAQHSARSKDYHTERAESRTAPVTYRAGSERHNTERAVNGASVGRKVKNVENTIPDAVVGGGLRVLLGRPGLHGWCWAATQVPAP